MKTLTLTAPACWASYLINGDASGLTDEELRECDAWIASVDLGGPVDCESAGFKHWHDARMYADYAADCEAYTFIGTRVAYSHCG